MAIASALAFRRLFVATLAIVALWRLPWLALRDLAADEAVYWVWSRNLALSYFDHPPMVALMIRAGTLLLGETELGVRAVGALLSLATAAVVVAGGRWLSRDPRVGWLAGLLWLASPISALTGSIMTPDTPVLFLGAVAMVLALAIYGEAAAEPPATPRRWLWIPFGAVLGLAFLSKYTAVLLVPPFGVLLLLSARGRRELLTPWPWLGVAVATAVFSPVIVWNMRNGWASFGFQIDQGLGSSRDGGGLGETFSNVGELVGGQILAWTPFYWLLTAPALWMTLRGWRGMPPGVRLAAAMGVFQLAFFLFSATRQKVELNWPLLSFPPLALATAWWIVEGAGATERRLRWGMAAASAAAVLSALSALAPDLAHVAGVRGKKVYEVVGWRSLAAGIAPHLEPGTPLFARDPRVAAPLSFYLPGQPVVWIARRTPERTSYTYFDQPPPLDTLPRGIFFDPRINHLREVFPHVAEAQVPALWRGRTVRTMDVVLAWREGPATAPAPDRSPQ